MAFTNVTVLERAEVKIEAVRGTAETTMTRFLVAIHDGIVWTYEQELDSVKEQTRSFHATQDQQLGLSYCRITFEGIVTYEDVVWWLNCALDGNNRTGTTTGSTPAGYTYDLTGNPTTDDLDTFTIKLGEPGNIYKLKRCAVNRLTLRWNPQQGGDATWRMTAEIFALFDSAGVAFDSPAVTTRTKVLSRGTKAFIDAASGTIGTTQVLAKIRSGEITIDNQIEEKVFSENVTVAHTDFARGEQLVTGSLVMEHNNDTQFVDMRAGTRKAIRIKQTGAEIGITPTTNYDLQLDMENVVYMAPSFGKAGQNRIMTIPFVCEKTATETEPLEVTVVNALATITA